MRIGIGLSRRTLRTMSPASGEPMASASPWQVRVLPYGILAVSRSTRRARTLSPQGARSYSRSSLCRAPAKYSERRPNTSSRKSEAST